MEEAFEPVVIDNIGSLFAKGPVEKTPKDKSPDVRNCKFLADSVRMRFGLTQTTQSMDTAARITGIHNFILTDSQFLLTFNSAGRLEYETVEGSGAMADAAGSNLGTDIYADFTQAYNRAFLSLTSLLIPYDVPVMVYKQGSSLVSSFVGIDNNTTPIASATSSGTPGDINTGIRYIIVLFETQTGYISGITDAGVFEATFSVANRQATLTGIPLGPVETVRRWVAFTEAGAPSAGPYFFITEDIVSPELSANITATKVDDNISTTATFNFTDDALVGGFEVTDFFDKIRLPAQNSVFFSPSTNRLIWTGESPLSNFAASATPVQYRVSEVNDPETYMGSNGFFNPGPDDGDRPVTAREWKGELYLLKANSGYVAVPSNSPPNVWSTPRRWIGSGPTGPWAVDVADEFMAFASTCGLHIYEGGSPKSISNEDMIDVWNRINWRFGHLIWVFIDTVEDEIHVGLPLDDDDLPTRRLTVYYGDGWDKLKWSLDDITAHREIYVTRTLADSPNPQVPVPNKLAKTQVLVTSANANGIVNMLDMTSIADNGQGINQVWQSAYVAPRKIGIYTLGGVDIMASGQGVIQASSFRLNNNVPLPIRDVPLDGFMTDHSRKGASQGERFSVRVWNGGMADSAFTLARITLYMRYMWAVRTV